MPKYQKKHLNTKQLKQKNLYSLKEELNMTAWIVKKTSKLKFDFFLRKKEI